MEVNLNKLKGFEISNHEKSKRIVEIKISEDISHINFFDNASFRYSEYFNFGTNIIFRDIESII